MSVRSLFELVVDIRENEKVVVRHVFYGDTESKALAIYTAHLRADAFLRDCIEKLKYDKRVACSPRTFWRVYAGILVSASD